jgi:glycosyltransferase involved in cell wall biosynthesis
MKQVLMTMFTFTASAGGITRVLMNRGRFLREAGVDARIALFSWDPNLRATVGLLKSQGRLAPDQPVLDMYSYYAAIADRGAVQNLADAPNVETSACPTRYERREGNVKREEIYVSEGGHEFLSLHFAAETAEIVGIELRDPRKAEALRFARMRDLHTHWLTDLARAKTPCAIIADAPKSANAVLRVRAHDVYRILTIHNNHYKAPYVFGSPWRDTYADILRKFEGADALAVLTHEQRSDIEEELGKRTNIYVIPNSVTVFPDVVAPKRDPLRVVAMARYHKTKGQAKIIAAFQTVLQEFPRAQLDLYGSGEEEQALRALVLIKGLSHSVSIKGYAVDVARVLSEASVAVSASAFEGFGIGIAEALSLGTPVVALDCSYGPGEIISDGEDGYLVHDVPMLAEHIIDLLRYPARARAMGEAGRKNMQRYSAKNVARMWLELFAALERAADTASAPGQLDRQDRQLA